jgi:hypothetical protein
VLPFVVIIMKPTLRFLLVITLLGFGILPALQPLFSGQLFGADGLLHFHRLVQLDRAVRHGLLYPRWLPDLGYGFGFPLFNYYAPLSYYLLLPLRWIGLSAQTSVLLGFAGALWALAIAVYLWGRDLFGERAGFVAALAAVYGPYILHDVYRRGGLASVWALVWLAMTAWAARRATRSRHPLWLALTALGSAALMLTHNITALMGVPLLIGYLLLLGWLHGFRALVRPLLALTLGWGLSAFFWLPAFLERDYVQIYQLYLPRDFDFRYNFIQLSQLLTPPRPVDPSLINLIVPVSLSWTALVLALAGWGPIGALAAARGSGSSLGSLPGHPRFGPDGPPHLPPRLGTPPLPALCPIPVAVPGSRYPHPGPSGRHRG